MSDNKCPKPGCPGVRMPCMCGKLRCPVCEVESKTHGPGKCS